MNFKISKSVFYNSLAIASRAISSYSPLPAFSGIKIEVKNDCIVLIGSDSDISIKTIIKKSNEESLEIKQVGSIVIEARYLLDIIRKMNSDEIEIEMLENASVRIFSDTSEFKINGMRANEYPSLDFNTPGELIDIDSELLKTIIAQTVYATSKSEIRPVLTGVNFNCDNHVLTCIGTDSYRLARKQIKINNDVRFNITIPARNLNEVAKTLDLADQITFAVNDKKAQFIIADTVIQTRLIDGAFPETSRLIPNYFDYEMKVDASEILSAIDRASFIKKDGICVIKLSMDENNCMISSKSNEVGSSKETLRTAQFKGDHLDISFNGAYVFDALRALKGGEIIIRFCGDMRPFIIEKPEDSSILQLILPLRTYD